MVTSLATYLGVLCINRLTAATNQRLIRIVLMCCCAVAISFLLNRSVDTELLPTAGLGLLNSGRWKLLD